MQYYQSELYKAKKDLLLTQALAAYHESMPEDHEDLDILEEVMAEHGFFQNETIETKPKLSIIQGKAVKSKRTKKPKLKVCK